MINLVTTVHLIAVQDPYISLIIGIRQTFSCPISCSKFIHFTISGIQIFSAIRSTKYQFLFSIIIKIFSDGDEIALGYKGGYDLILMDIEMTFMDGMSAAEEIRRADPEVLIIFITNSPQYAIKGYAVQALDYILKPLSYYAFCQRMNHVRELLGRRQKHFLTVPCAGGVQKLDASDIYYVEICDHDLLFHTKQGEVHSTGSMRDVEQKLPPENFFRSSKAYLVNLEHVDGIQDEDAIVNGERVQISRAKRKAFLAALNHYMGETI